METYAALTALFWVIFLEAVVITTISVRKFLKGDLKNVLKWMVFALWLTAFGYTLFLLRELKGGPVQWETQWATYLLMSIAAAYILKTALLLKRFADAYGFADLKVARKDEKRVKKRRSPR